MFTKYKMNYVQFTGKVRYILRLRWLIKEIKSYCTKYLEFGILEGRRFHKI